MHFPFTSFVSLSKYNTGFISSVVSGSIIVIGLCKFGVYFMSLYSVSCSEYNVSNLIGTGFLDILTSGIIGPIFEEVVFRVSFIPKVECFIYNKEKVIIITSIIFAILHFNFLSGFIAFIIGIINGYIYIKTRDIIKISLVHISLNTISSLITCYNNLIFILGIILMIEVILYFGKERYL